MPTTTQQPDLTAIAPPTIDPDIPDPLEYTPEDLAAITATIVDHNPYRQEIARASRYQHLIDRLATHHNQSTARRELATRIKRFRDRLQCYVDTCPKMPTVDVVGNALDNIDVPVEIIAHREIAWVVPQATFTESAQHDARRPTCTLGPWLARIDLRSGKLYLAFRPHPIQAWSYQATHVHPHVRSMSVAESRPHSAYLWGSVCMGSTGDDTLRTLTRAGQLDAAIDYATTSIRAYNPNSPYHKLKDFLAPPPPELFVCPLCGDEHEVTVGRRCGACQQRVCPACRFHNHICVDCGDLCTGCRQPFNTNHLIDCPCCDARLCRNCSQ